VVLSYSPENWQTISKLLDQALDLPREARESWLETLPEPDSAFREQLREMLAHQAAAETADFLETLPKLTAARDSSELPPSLAGVATDLRVGPYRLVRELGRGGMAVVWLAERADGQFTRTVALKVPLAVHAGSNLAQRFARERDILAKLEHPHIARFYDAGVAADGTPYFAMEFVEGQPIDAYCDAQRLNVRARLSLFRQVLDAVQYAHARLVIHRDLKPSNILVTGDGAVHLLDFGIAKLLGNDDTAAETQLTEVHGRAMTPSYASPEQIRGESLTTATDIYSVGVVLYQLLTGARPYKLKTSSPAQLELAIAEAEVVRPSAAITESTALARGATAPKLAKSLRGDLDTILLKALKKDVGDRYASAGAFAEDLRRNVDGEIVQARPDSAWYRGRKFIGRNRLAVASVAAVVVALAAGMSVALWQYQQAIEQTRIAREEAKTSLAVQGFMEDIFKANSTDQTDPAKARKTTAEELLDIAGKKMGGAMLDAPKARLRMLNVLDDLYTQLGLDDKAVTAAKLALDLTSEPGFAVLDQLDSLARYVRALGNAGRYPESDQWQERREALARQSGISDPLLLGRIAMDRANLDYEKNHSVEALSHIEQAIGLLRASGNKSALVEALTLQAVIAGHIPGREPSALSALLEARTIAEGEGGRLNGSLMQIYGQLSDISMRLDDPAGAVSSARQAFTLAAAAHTPNEDNARYESRAVAKALSNAGHPLEALEYLDKTWQLSDPSGPEVKSFIQYGLLLRWGVVQLEAGRPEEALVTADRLHRLRDAMPEVKGNPQETVIRVSALRELSWLDAADDAWQKLMREAPPEINAARLGWVSVAEMNLAHANAAQAKAAVLDAVSHEVVGTSLRSRLEVDVFLARAALMEGQLDEADRLTSEALKKIEAFAQRGALADMEAQMLWIRSRMLLERHDAAAALPLAQRAVTLFEAAVDPKLSLTLARMLGTLAEATLMTGDRANARKSLDRMEQIYARHPSLGPTAREDLVRVTRELAGKSGPAG
jgi:serine/threonine protein kinase